MKYDRQNAKAHSRATMRGIWAAANTPFNEDGSIDEGGFRKNVDHWVNDLGIDGLFVAGKQGEFFSMSVDERKRMFDLAVSAVGDKAQTIMSCSDQNMDVVIDLAKHAQACGAEVVQDVITHVDFSRRPFVLTGEFGDVYLADTVIICTGATAKSIGLPSETLFRGRGVSGCATCDGFFYKDMDCCVIGGGNTAVEEALFLTSIARKTYLVHRRDRFRAEPALLDRLAKRVAAGQIELRLSCELDEVIGDETGVTAVRLRKAAAEGEMIDVSGVFVAIGHQPNTTLFEGALEMNDGYIMTGRADPQSQTMTSVPGVFAAGDVQDAIYRQAVTSAGSGCMAALDARRYLEMATEERIAAE